MRSRRRLGRLGIPLVLVLAAAALLGGRLAVIAAVELGLGLMLLVVVALGCGAVVVGRRFARRVTRAPARITRPGSAPPDWPAARRRFEALRVEYAGHECDPLAVLRLPALTDVTVPATARFVDAFAEAQALDTDREPSPRYAASYVAAVGRAWRAWQAACEAADRIRLAGLSAAERASVQRVIKLLTVAGDSGHDAERLTAYGKARDELARLERAGTIHLPRLAMAALEEAARGRLPA